MTKNVTKTESVALSSQLASSSQINQNIDLLIMLNFMQDLVNSHNQTGEEKKQAKEYREFRKPKGMSNSQVMKRSNNRAHGLLEKPLNKVRRQLLPIENETNQTENITKLPEECLEIINKLDLSSKDKEIIFELTKAMRENFSENDLDIIYLSLESPEPGSHEQGGHDLYASRARGHC